MAAKTGALAKSNPQRSVRDKAIADAYVKGATWRQMQKQFGLSVGGLGYILKDPEVRDMIDIGIREMVKRLPKTIVITDELLDSKDDKIRLETVKMVQRATGVDQSHAPSVLIQQLIQNNTTVNITPEMQILQSFMDAQWVDTDNDPEIIDV